MKIVLSVPSYGPVDPQANRHLRVAVMHAAANGVEWVGDLSPDKMKFDVSRNVCVQGAIEHPDGADAILWADSDIILPPNAITELVAQGKDFICGIYCQRAKPHWPLIAQFDQIGRHFSWFREWPENAIAPIDGCGFGIVLTSTAMLRTMTPPWFTFEQFSEDFDFCLRAAAAGYQLYVHTGVLCGHLPDPVPVTVDDFKRLRDSGGLDTYVPQPVDSAA